MVRMEMRFGRLPLQSQTYGLNLRIISCILSQAAVQSRHTDNEVLLLEDTDLYELAGTLA